MLGDVDLLIKLWYIYKQIKQLIKIKNKTNMKKVLALLSIVALASCGEGSSTETTTTDSTTVSVDSTIVKSDSTKTDSTSVSVDSTK